MHGLQVETMFREMALMAVQSWPGGMHVGGGISPDNAQVFLDAGASHVIVTSYVFHNAQLDAERLQSLVVQHRSSSV